MVDPNKLCFGCMKEIPGAGTSNECPYCHFNIDTYKQNYKCLAPGTILAGKYLVGKVLGEGGFGITYIGFDLNMEAVIAVKEYFPVELVSRDVTTATGDHVVTLKGGRSYQEGLEKFISEARNVSAFSGREGIVSVKDFFYENNTAYMVMEYIEGESLKEYLAKKGGRLTEQEALRIIKPVVGILRRVNREGIIHRDLSPDNIMISKDGRVKLIDFGAARMSAGQGQKSLTVILKHGYAPEEQYRTHGNQGPWTDVYGICACLYRMMTGEVPVQAMDRLFEDSLKSFAACRAPISRQTEQVVMRGLAVKKDERIQDMDELYRGLYEGKRLKRRGNKRLKLAAAGLAVILICGALWSSRMKSPIPAEAAGAAEVTDTAAGVLEEEENQEQAAEVYEVQEIQKDMDSSRKNGEIINQYCPAHAAANDYYLAALICKPDGTVEFFGDNSSGKGDISQWSDITAVAISSEHSLGLKADGTVAAAGSNDYGRCSVDGWSGITGIAAGSRHSLGLKQDGTVISAGSNEKKQCGVGGWRDIIDIAAYDDYSVGIQQDGTVLFTGAGKESRIIASWPGVQYLSLNLKYLFGYSDDGNVYFKSLVKETEGPNVRDSTENGMRAAISGKQGFIQISSSFGVIAALKADGTVFIYDKRNRSQLMEAQSWTDMQAITFCEGIVGIKKDGTVVHTPKVDFVMPEISSMREIYVYGEDACLAGVDQQGDIVFNPDGHSEFSKESYDETWCLDRCKNVIQLSMGIECDAMAALTEEGELFLLHSVQGEGYPGDKISVPGAAAVDVCYEGTAVLFRDGTVRTWLNVENNWEDWEYGPDVKLVETNIGCENWTGIKQIWMVEADDNWGVIGLTEEGTLKFSEDLDMGAMSAWSNIRVMDYDGDSNHAAAICNDGKVLYYGDSGYGQSAMTGWDEVRALHVTGSHTVGLKKDGTVVAAGRNQNGQCDVGGWQDIVFVSAIDGCTLGIDGEGNVLIAGIPYMMGLY